MSASLNANKSMLNLNIQNIQCRIALSMSLQHDCYQYKHVTEYICGLRY